MALVPELSAPAQPQPKVDRKILVIDKVICRHIEAIAISSRGAVSQDILAQLRNFVEHIMLRFYANGRDLDVTYPNIVRSVLVHDKSFSKRNFTSDILWKTKWVNQNFVII